MTTRRGGLLKKIAAAGSVQGGLRTLQFESTIPDDSGHMDLSESVRRFWTIPDIDLLESVRPVTMVAM